MTFGTRFRQLRTERGILIKEVALRMGWSVPYISDIETGKKNGPRELLARKMARVIGAAEHADELAALAALSRTSVVMRIDTRTDPEVAAALIRLSKAYVEGRVSIDVARGIEKLMQKHTAA